ncbi:MAG: sulfatase [Bryobacterales bacterium]|nr:sulfatase [Bryobacterales bacterium]
MNRRTFLTAALGAPFLLRSQATERPNILFIAADDMNNNLGCYGHPIANTPNLDRLAARGVRFDRAYCQYPVCGPSRCSLLTGLRPDSTGIFENNIAVRDKLPGVITLPQLFKNNGWRSVRAGKMYHMDVPGSVGTNKWDDPPSWDVAISPPGSEQRTQGQGGNIIPGRKAGWQAIAFEGEGKDQADEKATEIALDTISSNPKRPWFLGLGYLRPHLPHVAPSRFFDLYPLDSIPLPNNPPGDLDDIPAAAKGVRPFLWNHMGMNERQIREARRGYYASTSFMDEQVGRVLDALERLKLAENTIVVFWGDHGWNLGEHTRWQKMSLMEDSSRVPLIVYAPGSKGNGKACQSLVEFVDIYPTLAALCGLKPPADLEGQSMTALLDNPSRPFKKAAFTQIAYEDITGRAMRTPRYRYIRWDGKGGGEELYDHQTDPGEITNLAIKPAGKAQLEQMRRMFDAGWRAARA